MKITKEQKKKGQDIYQQLVEKAWESATFKEQLISNPEATIEEVTGVKPNFSKETKIIVEDQTDSNITYLNIPRKVNLEDFELTDEELEIVAGGGFLHAIGYYAHAAVHALGDAYVATGEFLQNL